MSLFGNYIFFPVLSGILTDSEVVSVFLHFHGKNSIEYPMPFNTLPRNDPENIGRRRDNGNGRWGISNVVVAEWGNNNDDW